MIMWIVYKTINLINNKYYIGVHNTNSNTKSFYLGSGKLLKLAIKKYGRKNFIRETLATFKNEADAYAFEKQIITEDMLLDTTCYNITEGGGNPPTFCGENNPFYGKTHSQKTLDFLSLVNKGAEPWNKGIPRTSKEKLNISLAKKGKKLGPKNYLYSKKLTEQERVQMGLTDFKKGHIPWNKNMKGSPPPYSTKCVVHGCFFNSTTEASECFGVSRATIRRRCTKYNFPDCYYII